MTATPIFILFFVITLITGCVGTVQEVTPGNNLRSESLPTTFVFPGIINARPISHNKIELEFFPASVETNIVYSLYVNNSTTSVPIDLQSLTKVAGGRYLYTVKNLQANKEYKFKITARNTVTFAISSQENEVFARTFDNVVTDFDGVTKLTLVPGDTDESITVDWVAPAMSGVFTAGPYDTANYEISLISEVGGPGNINNPLYFGTDKRVIYVPTPPLRATPLDNPNSYVVENLTPNTRYYVQVRSINVLYRNYQEDTSVTSIPVNRESNTKYLSIKTESAGSLFDFSQNTIVLSNATGIDAFDKINVFWQPGTGSFSGYRIFVRKYDGLLNPETDDKLTELVMDSMNTAMDFSPAAASITNKRVTGLESGAWYQVKVALCKTAACPILSTNPNAAIISFVKSIKIQPTLAPFSGINGIEPPTKFTEKDTVNLRFDSPLVAYGYATELEFYCVNPLLPSQMIKFNGTTPISGSGIPNCEGLSLTGAAPPLASYTSQKVKGLTNDGTKQYCFAATPAIIGLGPDVRLSVANRIVRCSYPEVVPPTIAQFPGLNNTCTVSATNGNVTWPTPTGGIYSSYKVYWKEKSEVAKFSFPQAISGAAGYSESTDLAPTVNNLTITNLMPGKIYQVGVLAKVDFDPPAVDLYSEYNLKVIDCVVPLPTASFKGYTRIFAVGPKTDGRYPNDPSTKTAQANSYIYEAIDANGVPFEVAMDSPTNPNLTLNYTVPPGRDAGSAFNTGFDGAPNTGLGYSLSNEGIISLAWEDVSMSFPEADSLFATNQPAAPATRVSRKWGYRVFRSSDNKLTWKDLTATHGLIYATSYSYYTRANKTQTTTRMAFFTDYSVKSLSETHDSATAKDIERARTYHYRVVPVFNGQQINYTSGSANIVRVTLPPPNMALVHRWMANRARCMELEKLPNINSNYSCAYNGIGAKPKGLPYRVGQTVLDQGGDLLVDRNELGCRYSRGDKVDNPEIGASNFALTPGSKRDPDDQTQYPLFRGFRTIGNAEDGSTPLKGCVGENAQSRGATGTQADYPSGFSANYNYFLQGDCIGSHAERIALGACSAAQYSTGEYAREIIATPGVANSPGGPSGDCTSTSTSNPTHMVSKFRGNYGPNFIMQSEFLAVFYNTRPSALSAYDRYVPIEGPSTASLTSARVLNRDWNYGTPTSQCSINLASVDGSGFMKPRWTTVNDLGAKQLRFKGAYGELLSKTVDEITEVRTGTTEPLSFYNGVDGDPTAAAFKLPSSTLRNSPRYRGTTRIAKIMTSNSAKLPPLGKLSTLVAETLCSNYFVQTGIASDNGNFSPDSLPQSKRPLRRIEHVTAAAWPEQLNTTGINNYEATTIAGSCNGDVKAMVGTNLVKGALLSNRSTMASALSDIPLLTGSSPYNGLATNTETDHTAKCISRYGIQDLIGNLSEINSERFFCDYTKDKIYMGPVSATWSGGTGAESKGTGGPDIPFFNTNDQRYTWAVLKQGTLSDGSNAAFKLTFRDGSPARTDLKPWIHVDAESGYCSIVDKNPTRRTGTTDFFKDVTTGYWNPLYLAGGALNTTMIQTPQVDQKSVETWRNGDARYFDMGPFGIGPAFSRANSLALTGLGRLGKYFNPIIGFPLRCQDGSCTDPGLSLPNDNLGFSTTALMANLLPADDEVGVEEEWPIGNSQISNIGVGSYQYDSLGYTTGTVPTTGTSNSEVVNYLVEVRVDDPVTLGNPTYIKKDYPGDFSPGTPYQAYRVVWDAERDANFGISSGGKANSTTNGRYTASVNKNELGSDVLHNMPSDNLSGSRCAVMINEDP